MITSIYISTILSFLLTIYLLVLWLNYRREYRGIGLYLIGNGMVCVFTLMLSFQRVFHPFLTVVLANTFVIAGQVIIYLSLFLFSDTKIGRTVKIISIAIPVLLFIEQIVFSGYLPNLRVRVLAVTLTGLSTNVILLWVLIKARKNMGITAWFLMASVIIIILNAAVRIPLSMAPQSALTFVDMKLVQSVFVLIRSVMMAFWPFGFAMMILEKTRNKALANSRQKGILLQELSHRTKNNMDVIISLINWQLTEFPGKYKQEEALVRDILNTTQNRIKSLALVYKKLYNSDDLSRIHIRSYLQELSENLKNSLSSSPEQIEIRFTLANCILSIETAGHLGLILNELLTNSLKHAFVENNAGKIRLELSELSDGELQFSYSDNGVGIKADPAKNPEKMGMNMIKLLSEQQLQGKMEIKTDHGFSYSLRFKDIFYKARV